MTAIVSGPTVVTGAAGGLGRAVCRYLLAEGTAVAALDLDLDAARETVSGAAAGRAYRADVSDHASAANVIDSIANDFGAPVSLVNAAAIQRFAHSHELAPEMWQQILSVNLSGTYFMCRAVLPHMMAQGGGAIVNIASTAGLTGLPYDAAYCAAKGGVVQLTKALAVEYASHRIRVNAVAPGGMQTPMLHVPFPTDADATVLATIRRSRLGVATPDKVANVVAFLLSEAASYMTGSVVVADGGALA